MSTNEQILAQFLMLMQTFELPDYECELHFALSLGKQYRFDYAWPQYKVALEIDGGQYLQGGGRHNRDSDREKLNCAAMLGWYVFRASYQMLEHDPIGLLSMLEEAFHD